MKTIEITGPIGAGKSSVAQPLRDALLAGGLNVSLLDEVVPPDHPTLTWSLAFAMRHPWQLARVVRAVLAAPIASWHRRLILGLFLTVGGRLMRARRRVSADHWVIVDEGLVHRSVNVFAWQPQPAADRIAGYVSAVPLSAWLVVVDALPRTALRRVERRGLPKRLEGRPKREVRAFMERARQVVIQAADDVERRGGPVVRVRNGRSVRRAATEAAEAILAGEPARVVTTEPIVFRPRTLTVPRPDRAVRRTITRRATGLPWATVAEVLAEYGLVLERHASSITAPGARGVSMRAGTSSGEVVVKRYKRTATEASINVEHAILKELERKAFPAPRLRSTPTGETCLVRNDGTYAVFDHLSGYHHPHDYLAAPGDQHQLDQAAGRLLGRLHRALEGYKPPPSDRLGFVSRTGRRVRPVAWYVEELAQGTAPRRVREWVVTALGRLWDELEALPRTVVHGDFGPYNLLVRAHAPMVVIDFELARLDWRLVDLATGLPRFAQRRHGFDDEAARRVLDAYRREHDLPFSETRLIPQMLAFLSLQRAVIAWSRSSGGDEWEDEARRRLMLAEDLLAGNHAIVKVART